MISSKKRALILSLSFNYLFRMNTQEVKDDYLNHLIDLSVKNNSLSFKVNEFHNVLKQEYKRYIDQMEIPINIGKNIPLKENVFAMITCIINEIPLIVTGKPGSSKTLAMNLVTKSMKGNSSYN